MINSLLLQVMVFGNLFLKMKSLDGLWEFISEDEVTLFVKDFYLKNDSKGAVQKLFEESRRRWLLEHNFCNDITIVIGFFN